MHIMKSDDVDNSCAKSEGKVVTKVLLAQALHDLMLGLFIKRYEFGQYIR